MDTSFELLEYSFVEISISTNHNFNEATFSHPAVSLGVNTVPSDEPANTIVHIEISLEENETFPLNFSIVLFASYAVPPKEVSDNILHARALSDLIPVVREMLLSLSSRFPFSPAYMLPDFVLRSALKGYETTTE